MLLLLPREGKGVVEVELLFAGVESRKINDLGLQFHKTLGISAAAFVIGVGIGGTTVHPPLTLAVVSSFRPVHRRGVAIDILIGSIVVVVVVVVKVVMFGGGGGAARRSVVDEVVVERVRSSGKGGEAAAE